MFRNFSRIEFKKIRKSKNKIILKNNPFNRVIFPISFAPWNTKPSLNYASSRLSDCRTNTAALEQKKKKKKTMRNNEEAEGR